VYLDGPAQVPRMSGSDEEYFSRPRDTQNLESVEAPTHAKRTICAGHQTGVDSAAPA